MNTETKLLHSGQRFDPETGAVSPPIYQSAAYVFDSVDHAANVFDLKVDGRTYSRLMNPTNDIFENRMSELEGGIGAISTSSGQAAITLAILNIAETGDNIIASNRLYGGTWHLLEHTLKRMGIETRFVDPTDLNSFQEQTDSNTKCYFIEGIPNPMLTPLPIKNICEISHSNGIPTIVDNTITPYIAKPIELGASIVIYSTTKFIGGHGNAIGGMIIDSGNFSWKKNSSRFPLICNPDPSHGNINWLEAANGLPGKYGRSPYLLKLRNTLMRDIGACQSPFNSYLLMMGLETLPLRMEKHCENAKRLAVMLSKHEKIENVTYPSLSVGKSRQWCEEYLGNYGGAVIQFELKGTEETGKKFIESLQLILHVSNIGDARTLATHPASTTHRSVPKEDRKASGVLDGTIRMSVGIESFEDIERDIKQALEVI